MNIWIERLSRKVTDEESASIAEQIAMLEGLRQKTESLSASRWAEGLSNLAPYRLKASSSLKRGEGSFSRLDFGFSRLFANEF